ncbi:MAG: TRAP transporter substrate-binding protein DctP [Proteobacteria bacterium]|nr:TRAP transporter substrate-binding protein DctP [Pseudomonadota bacterium]
MKRRHFIAGTAGAAAAAIAAPALAQTPTVRWRMVTSWPKSLDTLQGSAVAMAERISQITEGKFQVQVFAAGEIVPALGVFDATSNGTVECSHTLSTYFFGRNPAIGFQGGMPFGLNTRQQQAWMFAGGGRELMRDIFAKYNIVAMPCGNVGVQMGGWFRKEVNSLDDLRGLKFRIGGVGGTVLSKLGVVPQQIAAGDIYTSLERGTIDAAEWVGPYDDEKLGFVKVARYYYTPGWWEGSGEISTFVNTGKWAELPPAFKAAYEAAASEQCVQMMAHYDAKNPEALRRLVAAGAQLRAFPRPVLDACYKATIETLDDIASKNDEFKKVYDSWKKFTDESNLWFRIAENTLDQFRFAAPNWVKA